ncbi:MAG: energy-coupling factor transporter transmembrane protein EcfT [Oscillospiraceae bacterium]|jgi:energy-coupling factor transport system permease protein|nr:energy-coupling factor transporter transmembrane protein EcfT [Oscillospiraceae bacterium]
MNGGVVIGQYIPGVTRIHRLDPRTKLIVTFAYVALVFCARGVVGAAMAVAYIAGVSVQTRIPVKHLLKGLKSLTILIAMTAVMNLFFTRAGTPIVSFGVFVVTDLGVRTAVYFAFRLVFLVMGTTMLTLSTSPIALTDGLESLMRPLERVRFPAHELAMMMSIALRFIPTLMEETDKIMKAQASRGADFETGTLIKRAKSLVPLLAPLFISAFRRAADLALAMESRCYQGGAGRTRMNELRFSRDDAIAGLIMLAMLAAALIERFVFPAWTIKL